MNTRRLNFIFYGIAAVFGAAGLGVTAWGVIHVPTVPVPVHSEATHHSANLQESEPAPSLAALQQAFEIDLRRPLFDPPPAPATPAPAAGLGLKLLGTVIEPGHSRAMLQNAEGKLELKGVGDACAEARILDIQVDSVTLSYQGKTLTLKVEKKGP